MMIIGFDAKRAFWNRRGLGNYSRDLIRLMQQYFPDNQYVLFTPKRKNAPFNPDSQGAVSVQPSALIDRMMPSLWRSLTMNRDIRRQHVDIYHGLSQELPFGIHAAAVKTVVTIHDAIFIRYPELYDSVYRTVFTQKNRYSCHVSDRIVAISEQTKHDCIEFFGADEDKIDVVYQGCSSVFRDTVTADEINQVRHKYGLPKQFLLSVGAIERRKNMGIILDAIYKGNIDMPLVIVGGKTAYFAELAKKIASYSLQNRVLFLHQAAFADFPAIYHAASCMIYPSLFEGFGLPILEALCTELPVITSKGGCFDETGGDAAFYIDPLNVDELVDAIQQVLSDSILQKDMKKKGLHHAELFTDEHVAHNMMQVYSKLV
ncbi:glycosyltransferase family 4 protein [Microbacter margulisiae]|uniref:Glycosyltransferase involved in cell wall biosynthesis n=1 Tax=Microbacter margulisiae TaxID=1350067 RepID=A0A7W5DQQ6_9PORP|nr:glycosyltransferase family 1 protein [Microbacter margulisiae]MBB3187334.1 glycosyltransferase involved in cell wall biosynthesis [Microbacter margulisiae]